MLGAASSTLIQRPDLAHHVRRVTEAGKPGEIGPEDACTIDVALGALLHHREFLQGYPRVAEESLKALSCCKNLQSMTWIDEGFAPSGLLPSFITVVQGLPIDELVIRTHCDVEKSVWQDVLTMRGLLRLSIWSTSGPPDESQAWPHSLGETLTHLELGTSAMTAASRTCTLSISSV